MAGPLCPCHCSRLPLPSSHGWAFSSSCPKCVEPRREAFGLVRLYIAESTQRSLRAIAYQTLFGIRGDFCKVNNCHPLPMDWKQRGSNEPGWFSLSPKSSRFSKGLPAPTKARSVARRPVTAWERRVLTSLIFVLV